MTPIQEILYFIIMGMICVALVLRIALYVFEENTEN